VRVTICSFVGLCFAGADHTQPPIRMSKIAYISEEATRLRKGQRPSSPVTAAAPPVSVLGPWWGLLQPLSLMLIYTAVFPREILPLTTLGKFIRGSFYMPHRWRSLLSEATLYSSPRG